MGSDHVGGDSEAIAHRRLTAALAASNVGTWDWMIPEDVVTCCRTTAELFGLPPEEGAAGVPLGRFVSAMHPQDRDRFRRGVEDVSDRGGPYVAEYRTLPAPGRLHRVISRGRFETDAAGRATRARGVVIDVTESCQDGTAHDDGFAFADAEASPLDRLADRALEMRELAAALAPAAAARLKPTLDLLLLEVGRQQAALFDAPSARPRRRAH